MIRAKTIRERLGWSQRQMAEHLGVDQSSISRIETGLVEESGPVSRLLDQLEAEIDSRPEPSDAGGGPSSGTGP